MNDVSDSDKAAGQDHTSACLLANSEPSAFRFCMMPSTLLELNSLKGRTDQHAAHSHSNSNQKNSSFSVCFDAVTV